MAAYLQSSDEKVSGLLASEDVLEISVLGRLPVEIHKRIRVVARPVGDDVVIAVYEVRGEVQLFCGQTGARLNRDAQIDWTGELR